MTADNRGYDRRASRFQYGLSAISPAGIVTGSTKEKGSLEPGGGLRNCGLRGTPLERVGSTAKKRRMSSHTPVDWTVYFYVRENISMQVKTLKSSRPGIGKSRLLDVQSLLC